MTPATVVDSGLTLGPGRHGVAYRILSLSALASKSMSSESNTNATTTATTENSAKAKRKDAPPLALEDTLRDLAILRAAVQQWRQSITPAIVADLEGCPKFQERACNIYNIL